MPLPVSVLILTKNEEQNLPGCLQSVSWADEIHVYDSFSEDATIAIARDHGALITQRVFDNWAEHQNWGLRNIAFKHPWVFYLDADERVTTALVQGIAQAIEKPDSYVAFQILRRDFFQGCALTHVQTSPYYQRLFRPEKMRYERLVNPVSLPDGPVGKVGGVLNHFPFSKGISQWLERHNSYSSFEARQIMNNRLSHSGFSLKKAVSSSDFHEKRFHQKEIFYRLPARPLVKFCLLYFLKRGFLDGKGGLTYAVLQSIYEYMIVLKTRELEQEAREVTDIESPVHTEAKTDQ